MNFQIKLQNLNFGILKFKFWNWKYEHFFIYSFQKNRQNTKAIRLTWDQFLRNRQLCSLLVVLRCRSSCSRPWLLGWSWIWDRYWNLLLLMLTIIPPSVFTIERESLLPRSASSSLDSITISPSSSSELRSEEAEKEIKRVELT